MQYLCSSQHIILYNANVTRLIQIEWKKYRKLYGNGLAMDKYLSTFQIDIVFHTVQ